MSTQTLNADTLPMSGSRLIEASAGTGKTYTIANLYLRLLLGDGDNERAEPLTVDQILVVTFTEAATAELRTRIRDRIVEARLMFSRGAHHPDLVITDPFMAALFQRAEEGQLLKGLSGDRGSRCQEAARILLQAERQMDESAIHTIHGFCQRMLVQNAFESGMKFRQTLLTDEQPIKQQVVEDYWRRRFYGLSASLTRVIRDDCWRSPQALLKDIERSLSNPSIPFTVSSLSQNLNACVTKLAKQTDALKAAWRAVDFEDLTKQIAGSLNGNKFRSASVVKWRAEIEQWANSPDGEYSQCEPLSKFTQTNIDGAVKKGKPPLVHPVFTQTEAYLAAWTPMKSYLLVDAIVHCREGLAQTKRRGAWWSFDDLLSQLEAALSGEHGGALAERIRQLYPVAMIDEFQDTDPLQYRIFSGVYGESPECGLLMIGDPKQAIYAFRGADIFTYISARKRMEDHYNLGVNWRSSAEMVAATNSLFERRAAPFFYAESIPFYPVQPKPNASDLGWRLAGKNQPAMTLLWGQSENETGEALPLKKGEYQRKMAEGVAAEIQRILTLAQTDDATLVDGDSARTIEAGDIAILVRKGAEGRLMRDVLSEQNIASVYLSDRDSVFAKPEAKAVYLLMQGVLFPEQERHVRSALGAHIMGLTAQELDQFNRDEWRWEGVINQFKDYRDWWQKKGVMPMIRRWMSQWKVAERLLTTLDGERRLTDLLHIAELLQTASQTLDSDHALLRWLADRIAEPNGNVDEQQLRLESESRLVKIVTIHKSKGLEYPLVFVPFVCDAVTYQKSAVISYHDPESLDIKVDVSGDDEAKAQAEQERLAEDLRLLYVAVTRAKLACYLGVAPVTNARSALPSSSLTLHLSALGYLLSQDEKATLGDLQTAIQAWQTDLPSLCVRSISPLSDSPYAQIKDDIEVSAAEFTQQIDRQWWTTSYSALVKQGHHGADHAAFDMDSAFADGTAVAVQEVPERSVFSFPKGARPGTFLHTIFEEIEFTEPVMGEKNTEILTQLLQQSGFEIEWLPTLQTWVSAVLNCPLDGKNLRLSDKLPTQRLAEMEFVLPIRALSAVAVNEVIRAHDEVSRCAGQLGFHTVSGLLKGFIDLIFEHEGRYYVLDWKSNHLGDTPEHYTPNALVQAMAEHRYDWQYQIYALALHRFLKERIADYDHERHFGGVYYLFLRGMTADGQNGVFFTRPSLSFLDALDSVMEGQ